MIDLDLNRVGVPLQWPEIFDRTAPVDVEIGSGKGKFLLELAPAEPERDFLAVERAGKYHRLCCDRAAQRGISNVRLVRTTAEDLLFRLIKPDVVAAMNAALIPDGRLLIKTDHEGYADVISEVLHAADGFTFLDPEEAYAGLPITGFEEKYRKQGRPIFPFALQKTA